MLTSSKRIYAIHHAFQVFCCSPRAPVNEAGHYWPMPPRETLKHSKRQIWLSLLCWVSLLLSLCPDAHKVCLHPQVSLVGLKFYFKCDCIPPTNLLGLLLLLGMWGVFWWDPTFSCWWCSAAGWNFDVFIGERWAHIPLLCLLKSSLWEGLRDCRTEIIYALYSFF